jgi:sugar phosphate isomerase/epimerase
MLPRIGITTQVIRKAKWYKQIKTLGFDTIEINRYNSNLPFDLFFLEKVKQYTHGCELSIHSSTKGVFQTQPSFTEANLTILLAEIDLCTKLGAGHLVFHLSDDLLSKDNKNRLQEVVDYAVYHNIRMMFEPNSYMVARHSYDVLESFPQIGYVLDMSHLNCGLGRGTLGCDLDDFIRNVRHRVDYLHVSNNWGSRDDHNALHQGTLNWHYVLGCLDMSRIDKLIIEVRSMDMVKPTFSTLLTYFQRKYPQNNIHNAPRTERHDDPTR